MKKNLKNKRKKSYQKPLIEEVELKPEEAVLTGCKVVHGTAGPGGICHKRAGSGCQGLGS